jgi:hypothetical protein
MFSAELVVVFMIYLCIKFHMSNLYVSLVVTIKLISKYIFHAASILLYIL